MKFLKLPNLHLPHLDTFSCTKSPDCGEHEMHLPMITHKNHNARKRDNKPTRRKMSYVWKAFVGKEEMQKKSYYYF